MPSCNFFPIEAVKTNILGTENVLNAAVEAGVRSGVPVSGQSCLSVNAMGISKAMMERHLLLSPEQFSRNTLICRTRYGNVMASRGSVIPFSWSNKGGKPLAVTDPHMTRFLMSLEEAVQLVLYAFENAETGDMLFRKRQLLMLVISPELCWSCSGRQRVQVMGPDTEENERCHDKGRSCKGGGLRRFSEFLLIIGSEL